MGTLHFIMGKGGVGRSTFAATLATKLSLEDEGPILLIDVQGSGRSLQLCGLEGPPPYQATPLPKLSNAWGTRLLPREAFRQYFSLLLALGNEDSTFASATSVLRERLTDKVIENKIVSAFIDVCPGLEPAVLTGKVHWEAAFGRAPESQTPWRHVIVDGPATGHGLMLFRSTNALTEVFGGGVIFRQAAQIMAFLRDPTKTRLYAVTTPEELPVRETLELRAGLASISMRAHAFIANRCVPPIASLGGSPLPDPIWEREALFERDSAHEQREAVATLREGIGGDARLWEFPELFVENPVEMPERLVAHLSSPKEPT